MTTSLHTQALPTWDTLDRITSDAGRYVNLCAIWRRNDRDGEPTGEILLEAGGQWDRTANKGEGAYTGRNPERCRIYGVNEAQLGIVDDLRTWWDKRRRGDDSRDIIIEAGGSRGGGKTHILAQGCIAIALWLPRSKSWIFNPVLDKREEVEDILKASLPRKWAKNPLRWPTSVPDCRFRLVNESSIRNLSGEIPNSAKRGEAECIFINEGQQQRRKVYSLSLYGIRKRGGLMLIATNPPEQQFPAGEWVLDLKEKIEAGEVAGTFRDVDPRKNPSVHAPTMGKIAQAIEAVDPAQAAGDVRNEWNRIGKFAYPKWRPFARQVDGVLVPSMVREPPDIGDITTEALRRAGWHGNQTVAIGTDHQTTPHHAGAAVRVFRHLDASGSPTGKNVYVVVDEILSPEPSEVAFSDALLSGNSAAQVEYDAESALLIPDCSADFQVANRQASVTSIKVLESQGWRCKPPTEILRPDRSKHPKNPPVHHSLAQMGDVMAEGRFFVAPWCKWTIEALEKTPLKNDGDRVRIAQTGGYAHICDGIRYVIWFLEPKKRRRTHGAPKITAIDIPRTGHRTI